MSFLIEKKPKFQGFGNSKFKLVIIIIAMSIIMSMGVFLFLVQEVKVQDENIALRYNNVKEKDEREFHLEQEIFGKLQKYKRGDRVLANWLNKGKYYSAVISEVSENKVTLMYDDGATETTLIDHLKQMDWNVGSAVECNWKAKGKYYKCTINAFNKTKYQVLYSNGETEWTSAKYLRSN